MASPAEHVVGFPRESTPGDRRTLLTPTVACVLREAGFEVLTESGIGAGVFCDDAELTAQGVRFAEPEQVWSAPLVLRYKNTSPDDVARLRRGQSIGALFHAEGDPALLSALMASGVTAYSYEFVEENGGFPLAAPGGQIAGIQAVLQGAQALQTVHGGRGVLLAHIAGAIAPRVVVIGSGNVGSAAARTAAALGAHVTVLTHSQDSANRYLPHAPDRVRVAVNPGAALARAGRRRPGGRRDPDLHVRHPADDHQRRPTGDEDRCGDRGRDGRLRRGLPAHRRPAPATWRRTTRGPRRAARQARRAARAGAGDHDRRLHGHHCPVPGASGPHRPARRDRSGDHHRPDRPRWAADTSGVPPALRVPRDPGMTAPNATTDVVGSYARRARFARAETSAVRRPRLLDELLRAATHAAEIPCGTGHFLADYARAGAAVTLVDACPAMLDGAVEHAVDVGLPAARTFPRNAYLQQLPPLDEVDLVVAPNAAINQLACQSSLTETLAALRSAVARGVTMLAQVACTHPGGGVDTATFYDAARQHRVWFPDRWFAPGHAGGAVLRRRRQYRDGDPATRRVRLRQPHRAQRSHHNR